MDTFITAQALSDRLNDDDLLLIQVGDSQFFSHAHIPGAHCLEYAALTDSRPPVDGLLPDADHLSQVFSELGLTSDKHVVAYDAEGCGRSARLIWTLDAMGHSKRSMLDGGLTAWSDGGFATVSGLPSGDSGSYSAKLSGQVVASQERVLAALDDDSVVLLDCRSEAEYLGERSGASRAGHIPGAVNLDWMKMKDETAALKDPAELQTLLSSLGVTPDKTVITYCQSHHRSAFGYCVLKQLGYAKVLGYHGSWSDWGNDADLPIE